MANKTRKKRIGLKILLGIIIVLVILLFAVLGMSKFGKIQLKSHTTEMAPTLGEEDIEEDWEEGWVRYKGEPYVYNEEILTFLFMGIDSLDAAKKSKDGTSGGQADGLFLIVMNPKDKTVNVIAMNRNMMAQVDVYDKNGVYQGQHLKQITLQHGYGDGMEESCERTVSAISRHLYNLPINGYVAVNMGAIRDLNAAVGGVPLTVLEDIDYEYYGFRVKLDKGQEVTLNGDQAYVYISKRDYKQFDSASGRVERQKQYIDAFIPLAKQKIQKDLSFAMDLYKAIEKYMVTDIEIPEFTYLVTEVLGYNFDAGNLITMPGETIMGEEFEEFYVDEEALKEIIMELFYEPAKQ